MTSLDLLTTNLLSPVVLAFILGVFASWVKSDLEFPDQIYAALAIYLLLALGLKGGFCLADTTLSQVTWPIIATLALGFIIPFWVYGTLRKLGGFSVEDAAALAAHYGSVSAVTFLTCMSYLQTLGIFYEGFMPALLAILEVPAIVVALMLAFMRSSTHRGSFSDGIKEIFVSKSVLLLIGGLVIGYITGPMGKEKIGNFFIDPFQGVLVLFLLELGLVAGRHFKDVLTVGPFLVVFAIVAPILNGALGVWVGSLAGLSVGGCTILGVMAASASYIAAPAAVRISLPEANPGYYLTASLAITFPFNLAIGIPLYLMMAEWLLG